MEKEQHLTARQLRLWSWCALLSPLVRQTPLAMVRASGRCAWVAALLSLLPLGGMLALMGSLLRRASEGEGLGEQFLRALGARLGRFVLFLVNLWLLFYAGFVLRAGADRFIATVYPNSGYTVFLLTMGALGAMAGLGRKKTLGRLAEVIAPVLTALFLLLFPAILCQVDWRQLRPITKADLAAVPRGLFPAADTVSLAALCGFVAGGTGQGRRRKWVFTLLGTVGLVTLLCVSTVGVFGAALTARMYYPFFVLLRNIRTMHLLQRMEPLLIAQWVATDLLLYALLLHGTERNWQLCLGRFAPRRRVRVIASLFLSLASAFLCARDSFALLRLSETWIPAGNAVLLFGAIPMIWCVGKLRHTI